MEKSLTKRQPKYLHAVFAENKIRNSHYDSAGEMPKGFPFSWFRISDVQSEFLRKQGAVKVAESFEGNKKVLFTGMRQMGTTQWYEGDYYINGKKSLILFRFHTDTRTFDVWLFPKYYPKVKIKRNNFIWTFAAKIEIPDVHTQGIPNVQSNTGKPIVCKDKGKSNS